MSIDDIIKRDLPGTLSHRIFLNFSFFKDISGFFFRKNKGNTVIDVLVYSNSTAIYVNAIWWWNEMQNLNNNSIWIQDRRFFVKWPQYHIFQIAKFMGPSWGPPGSRRPQMGPMLAPWSFAIRDGAVCETGFRTNIQNGGIACYGALICPYTL